MSWDQHDYLAVTTGYGWGRAKNAREAVRIARANSVSWIKQVKTYLYRLSDEVDTADVQSGIDSFHINIDAGEIVKVALIEQATSVRFIPETYEPVAI